MKALFAASIAAELLSSSGLVEAKKHHLFVSSYRTKHIFALSYDDQEVSLQHEKTIPTRSGHPWLALNHERTVLYGGEKSAFSSYAIAYPSDLFFATNVRLDPRCEAQAERQGQTILVASQNPPYKVYGAGRNPCGAVLNTRPDGVIDRIAQSITYRNTSRIQGMAMDPQGQYLFSADQEENGVWVHKLDQNGQLDRGRVAEMHQEDSKPRRLAIHPAGKYLYVLFRKMNKVGVFEIQPNKDPTRAPKLRFANTTISLIPEGVDAKRYRGSEISISADGRVLYGTVIYRPKKNQDNDRGSEDDDEDDEQDYSTASTNTWGGRGSGFGGFFGGGGNSRTGEESNRGGGGNNRGGGGNNRGGGIIIVNRRDDAATLRSRDATTAESNTFTFSRKKEHLDQVHTAKAHLRKRQSGNSGFLTAVLLSDPQNSGAKGFPLQMIMQVSTATSGGKSNIITPASWDPSHFAISDSEHGLVQIWKLDGLDSLPRDGPRGNFNGIPYNQRGQGPARGPTIRATIMAEWRAPPEAVGDVNQESGSSDRDLKARPDQAAIAPKSGRARRQESYTSTSGAAGPVPSGRGCCANAIWLD